MIRRGRTIGIMAALLACATSVDLAAWETSANVAFQKSRSTGRPLLIMGTSAACGPCHRMKATLAGDRALQTSLSDSVVLVLDAADPDFQAIIARYGVPVSSVPMVYLISSNDELLFAGPGALDAGQIKTLLASAKVTVRRESAVAVDAVERQLDEVRVAAKEGDLLLALRLATPIAESSSPEQAVLTARSYREQITKAIDEWLVELDGRMSHGEGKYEAAYHLAKIYAHTPVQYTMIRQRAFDLVRAYEEREETRVAVTQAKHLVRARAAEEDKRCDVALQDYQYVKALNPSSPAGAYARQRIPIVTQKIATKLTNAS
jgi:hypothetical protein